MKTPLILKLTLLVVVLLALAAGCKKSAAEQDASPHDELSLVHSSFRDYVAQNFPTKVSRNGHPDPRRCTLQNAVMARSDQSKTWVGQVAGKVTRNDSLYTVRVTFNRMEDGTWKCDPAQSTVAVRSHREGRRPSITPDGKRNPLPPPPASEPASQPASQPATEPASEPASEPADPNAPTDACAFLVDSCGPNN